MRKTIVENSQNLSDEQVVTLIKQGEYQLFSIMVERYMPLIVSMAVSLLPKQYVDDAVQEATIALYSSVKSYDLQKSSFYTFASLCIKRSVITFARKSGAQKQIPDDLISSIDETDISDRQTPEKIVIDREDYDSLTQSIKLELSKMEFEILQLFLTGMPYSDIAKALDITEKSVDNALVRIRRKLKK